MSALRRAGVPLRPLVFPPRLPSQQLSQRRWAGGSKYAEFKVKKNNWVEVCFVVCSMPSPPCGIISVQQNEALRENQFYNWTFTKVSPFPPVCRQPRSPPVSAPFLTTRLAEEHPAGADADGGHPGGHVQGRGVGVAPQRRAPQHAAPHLLAGRRLLAQGGGQRLPTEAIADYCGC